MPGLNQRGPMNEGPMTGGGRGLCTGSQKLDSQKTEPKTSEIGLANRGIGSGRGLGRGNGSGCGRGQGQGRGQGCGRGLGRGRNFASETVPDNSTT